MQNLTNLLIKIIIYLLLSQNAFARESSTELAETVTHAIKYSKFNTLKQILHNKQLDVHLRELIKTELFLNDSNFCNFESITQFIHNNPNLHRKNSLLHQAEKCITNNTNKKQIMTWFNKHYPRTPSGHKFYALSAADVIKKNNSVLIKKILNDSWIEGDFTYEEQLDFYNKYYKYLHYQTNIKKIDRLIHKGQHVKAQHLIKQLNKNYQKTFNLYLRLKKDDTITNIQNNSVQYTPGTAYQYLNNLLKHNKLDDYNTIIKMFRIIEKDSFFHQIAYRFRMSIIFHYIRAKKYNLAYKTIVNYHTVNKNHNLQIQFLSGLICLNFLDKKKDALKYFHEVINLSSHPEDSARGRYWLARTYEKVGDNITANKVYKKLIEKYQRTFYGYMASIKLNQKQIYSTKKKFKPLKPRNIHKREIEIIKLFIKKNLESLARIYIKNLINNAKNNSERLYLVEQLKSENMIYNHFLARTCVTKGLFIEKLLYPVISINKQQSHIETTLLHSIIYQESSFNPNAANTSVKMPSIGLMQLNDDTGADIAKRLKMPYQYKKLFSPEYNILLGSYYMKKLQNMFNQSYVLSIASYNAGFNNVRKWTKYIDYPQNNIDNILVWIELIPFVITRNYVSKVLGLTQTYENIMNKHNNIVLHKYLINNLS